jgi:ubiquinone/menaquinone biosynthesis C-methylase UbiE
MSLWATHVLPTLIEKACRSTTILAERRRWIPRARGDVVELGIGSGLNLPFYDARRVHSLTGIDPSVPLLARARSRAATAPVPVELVLASAERLPFGPASFDSAVVTYSLCSVSDPASALAEVRRVLRPDGELIVVEHGLAPDDSTRHWQRRLTPLWRRVSGNCHLDRDIVTLLRSAGFEPDELRADYSDGVRWLSYTYQGVARILPADGDH